MANPGVNTNQGPAAQRYAQGEPVREPYLIRARRLAKLTITSLYRNQGANGTTEDVIAWQSATAYLINNLSAKRTLALYPPGIPFTKLKPSRQAMIALGELDLSDEERGDLQAKVEKGLSKVEVEMVECCEEDGDRAKHFDAARHLIVGGNHCLKFLEDDTLQSISLENYVTWRDGAGNLLEFVIRENLSWETVPEDVRALCDDHAAYEKAPGSGTYKDIQLYTHGVLSGGKFKVYQEAFGKVVPGTDWTWDKGALPYLFLGEIFQQGEHYARSYCEDYEADLQTLDAFWQMLTEGGAAIARLLWLIKPGSALNKRAFERAQNGEALTGELEDVTALRAEKGGDLKVAFEVAQAAERRLERMFLVFQTRQGERVTAEEIREVAQQLEATQGGVYSNQVTTYQRPYAQRKLAALQRSKRLPKLPKDAVKVTVLTGDAALGRARQSQNLREFIGTWTQLFPEVANEYLRVENAMVRDGANIGLDTDGLVRSEDDVQADRQAAQQVALSQQVAPEVVKQGGEMLQQQQQAALSPETPAQ